MTTIILYAIAFIFLFISFIKDREKTYKSIKKAWNSFTKLLPDAITMMFFVGISLAIINPKTISHFIGSSSGYLGIIIALLIGSITMIPSFVAFPLAGALLNGGAGYPQVAAFISTLMAVGIVTIPMEIKYFNKSTALLRNVFSLLIAIIFTLIIGQVM